ncbi:MAG: Lrp/AsnC family transcriptional regulator [Spirochaetia bacterium]|jgi:Lrp/AsnC family transcriptional regulator, regulator for asnA, asnC and gidA|nr:Lrp/AsnC family transcriptional regulator [Spirochaetia bacterium]
MKIDDTNKAIIKQLRDGRKSYSAIADELSITENTVRARVNKLMDEKVLEITGLVDPSSLPNHKIVIMGIKLKTLDLGRKAKEFTQLRGVVFATVVTGRYDLIVQVLINENDGYSLLDFFNRELVKVSEIQDVETFVVYESFDLRVPYIL